ncbi:MAG: PAS domain S-box protein [Cyclobacteriaceae bacterium]|jgi:PAS domain S-box-containing protein
MKAISLFADQRQEILNISRRMIAAQDENAVTQTLVDGLCNLMHYDTMAVYLAIPEESILRPLIVEGPSINNPDLSAWSIPLGTGIIGDVLAKGVAERIENAHLDDRSLYPSDVEMPEEQLMVFPLKQGDKSWGALVINRISTVVFTQDEFEIAEFLASYASLALNNTTLIKKLREKEQAQTTVLKAIPDSIFRIRQKDNRLVVVSKSGKLRPIESILEESLVDLYHRNFLKSISTQGVVTFEHTSHHKNQQVFFEARIVFMNDGECLALVRNVTEAKAIRKELQKSEALKRIIVDTISDVVITVDRSGTILFVNEVAEKMFGYTKQELEGKKMNLIIPDYLRALHEKAMANYVATGKRKLHSWIGLELPGLHRDHYEVPLEISFGETKIEGEYIFSAIIRDISLRKKEEALIKSTSARMSRLLQTMHAGVLVEDENRKIVLSNQNFCSMFGIPASPEMMIGGDCSQSAEQSKGYFTDPEGFVKRIDQLLAERKNATGDELTLVDGRVFDRDYVPIYVDEQYKGHMWVYRDITTRKQNEAELVKAKKEAESSMKAKQEFLAHMSHELRTPINGVLGLANLVSASDLSITNEQYIKGIRASGEHLLSLINDILDLAKIEAGKLQIVDQPFSLKSLLATLVDGLSPLANQKGIKLLVSLDATLPNWLIGDAVRVNQILLNLISNAIKFTNQGSVTLACLAQQRDEDYLIEFAVRDTGIGIASEKLESIFESFTQANNQISIQYGGTGLGLSIVKELTGLMHGNVLVDSELGVGSSFVVLLPFKAAANMKDEIVPAASPFTALRSFKNKRVLVAEDNKINQLVVRSTLNKWDLHVTLVENGQEVLDELKKQTFDLVILDVQMPILNGLEATQLIRTTFPEPVRSIPIMAMTASVMYDPEQRVKEIGMNDYIAKPFKVEDLHAKISRLLAIGAPNKPKAKEEPAATGKLVNLRYLNQIAPGDASFALEMLCLFEKNSSQFLTQAKTDFIDNNFSSLSKIAHSFKPQGAYLGVDELKDIIGALENISRDGKDVDKMAGLLAQAEVLIEIMQKEIPEIKSTLK